VKRGQSLCGRQAGRQARQRQAGGRNAAVSSTEISRLLGGGIKKRVQVQQAGGRRSGKKICR